MNHAVTFGLRRYQFDGLRTLLAKASPLCSDDQLACLSAENVQERVAAQMALADIPMRAFLNDAVIPHEMDEVTRLIMDSHCSVAFAPIAHFTVGEFRDCLLAEPAHGGAISAVANGVTPEMAAAVSKLIRNQDPIAVAKKCLVVTAFRTTLGLPGYLSVRLQPNHPVDDPRGVAASILDGLMYDCGDVMIGINPATDDDENLRRLLHMLDELRQRYAIPINSCVSSPGSLGIYLTWASRRGRSNAERECISNIRPGGLSYPNAAKLLSNKHFGVKLPG